VIEALLIWIILRRLSIPGAFLAALIFAVHPVNVESVAWISQGKNLMAMLFFLLSVLWYLKSEVAAVGIRTGFRSHTLARACWYWLSLLAFVFSMLSKISVVILPPLVLGIIWWQRPLTRRDVLRIVPFLLAAVALLSVNVLYHADGPKGIIRTATVLDRVLGSGGVIWFYLYKALFPLDLTFVYPQWQIEPNNWLWWLPLTAAIAITVWLWLHRNSWGRPFLFGWGFFCVSLLPVLGFVDISFMEYSLVADHYQHIALIGIISLVAASLVAWQALDIGNRGWPATLVAFAVVGILTGLTWQQNKLYANEILLYRATLEQNPDCWVLHQNLAVALLQEHRIDESITAYKNALRVHPNYPEVHVSLGSILAQIGKPDEAIEHCRQALQLKPDYPEAHVNLGAALVSANKTEEAIQQYKQALELRPDYAVAHFDLAVALAGIGQTQDAIEHYQKSLDLKHDYLDARVSLGTALMQTGKPHEAIEQYKQALAQKADNPVAHYNLGNALIQIGDVRNAAEHFREAVRLDDKFVQARLNLGAALIQAGLIDDGVEQYKRVLALKPDYTDVYANLARAYAMQGKTPDAVAAAQKAVELARSQSKAEQAQQIENWLDSYRARQQNR
jgi:protein O-mannosyl-transferase